MTGRIARRRKLAAGLVLGAAVALPVLVPVAAARVRDDGALRLRLRALSRGATFLDQRDVVLQRRGNDCGPAALAMALSRLGHRASLSELSASIPLGPRGCSLLDLLRAAEDRGARARGYRLSRRDLSTVRLPCILHLSGNHFVVAAARRADGRIEVLDPSLGRVAYQPSILAWRWDGNVLVFDS